MEEQATLDQSLSKILELIGNRYMEETEEFNDDSRCFEAMNFGDFGSEGETTKVSNLVSLLEVNFSSREALLSVVHETSLMEGYVTIIKRSKPDKCVFIACDRGGKYRDTRIIPSENRKRKTTSRLIDCPFEVVGRRKSEGVWKVDIKSLLHNHEPATDMSRHLYCRRFSQDQILRIKEMCKAGVSPRQIMSSLRQSNPDLLEISRNIYNEKHRTAKENLGDRTIIQALLDELSQDGFIYNTKCDQNGRLPHLMFAHPLSVIVTKSYNSVFVMDCTYKTNKYKIPLLDIVGVTSFNTSFYSCFVFMQKEEEKDYAWALTMFSRMLGVEVYPSSIITDRELALINAICIVFPRTANILCVWHIEKNIVTNCKPYFAEETHWLAFMSTWTSLINSYDESSFNEAWKSFESEYKNNVHVLNYIQSTWLPMKQKFVMTWTSQIEHFGNRVTSRGECAHSNMKSFINSKFDYVVRRFVIHIKLKFHSSKSSSPVSVFALNELFKQYELEKSGKLSAMCKGQFYKTTGLPCGHMIRETKFEVLQLNVIHKQWRIDTRSFVSGVRMDDGEEIEALLTQFKSRYEMMPLTEKDNTKGQLNQFLCASVPLSLEPNVQPNKKEHNSTKRDPSAFEIMERKARTCSYCKGENHDVRTCSQKKKASMQSYGPPSSPNLSY